MNDMTDRIKAHLEKLMLGAPNTRRVEETRQELLAGCLDKYEDLTGSGMEPELAYLEVVDGIGDVTELLGLIEKADTFDPVGAEDRRRKRAFFTSAGICCYFVAAALMAMFGGMGYREMGLGLFIVFCGIATMLIIYGRMTTATRYERADDTLVEELKAQMSEGKREHRMAGLASSTLWSLAVALYFVASFLTTAWHVTWILFPLAAAVQCCISARLFPRSRYKALIGAFWCLVVTVYFILSFYTFAWHVTWILFPFAVAVQQALRLFSEWRSAA